MKKLFKPVTEYFYGVLGGMGYWFGASMADGFRERCDELDEEEHQSAINADMVDVNEAGKKDFGAN